MKITDFLKKYSLINEKFIDDFYSFYNDGKNEYDFTINLDNIAFWLDVKKEHLKRLLESNFVLNQDYIEEKKTVKGKGRGASNIKHVLLTYTCSKLLCMISKCEKANLVRNYYIELEKILIKHKDDIVKSLNDQLGIKNNNKEIIEDNKNTGLIYILQVDDEVYKLGNSSDIKKRMKQYNVGRINELPIVFVYKTNKMKEIEKCLKNNLKEYQKKKNTEIFKIDLDFIKETIKYCTLKNALLVKHNKKLYNNSKNWLIILDKNSMTDVNDLYKKPKKYIKKLSKKSSKLLSKKSSKKSSKRLSKKSSKILSKNI
jgi:phage anti-repressor protein